LPELEECAACWMKSRQDGRRNEEDQRPYEGFYAVPD
jgi:hypothetical protein